SLMLHKLRSALTTLGILIGVAAVVAMLAIGEGASQAAQEQIKRLGSTNILIQSIKPPVNEQSSGQSSWSANIYGLTYQDARRIRATLGPHIELMVEVRLNDKEIRVADQWLQSAMLGTAPDYLDVMGLKVARGRWLSDTDNRTLANVCVLGGNVASRVFPMSDPIGSVLKASGNRFVVVGELEPLGRQSGHVGRSIDECVFVPMSTSRRRFGEINIKESGGSREIESVELHEIKVKVDTEDNVAHASEVIKNLLQRSHKQQDYSMTVPLELLRQARESKRRFQLLLFSIALISLIVGGIGIMNVMLATVTERTREIGIRRALGARKRNIIDQFLVETVVLAGAGGVLGLIVGLLFSWAAHLFWDADVYVRPRDPVMAFAISGLVGIFAGVYPAWRAANMDPVEALRHE
ncbi:MAG: ABC transporter permease, partial [Planctomycetes bacterium]|nr:ABC transporter permease [Planctomycetota bacterium]